MKKKIIFLIVILAVASGGFFWLWTWQPKIEPDFSIGEPEKAPTLFSKGDYKVVEKEDGKYIVVEKVGLTAKVPEGWKIEIEGSDVPEPEYWVNLYSPHAEVKDILIKGCGIGITVGMAKEKAEELKEKIQLLQQKNAKETPSDRASELVKISTRLGIRGITKNPTIGKAIAINIPIGENIIRLDTLFLPEYEEKCSLIWEDFLKNVVIE